MAGIFSYAKTLWQDGVTAITAARLNHIEQGISDAADSIKTIGDSVSPKRVAAFDGNAVTVDLSAAGIAEGVYLLVSNTSTSESKIYYGILRYKRGGTSIAALITDGYTVSVNGVTLSISQSPWYTNFYLVRIV